MEEQKNMDKRAVKFIKGSFFCAIAVCVAVLVWMTVFMAGKTRESIVEVSDIYMSEMNEQIQQKFWSIITLRLEQVEGIIRQTPPETAAGEETVQKALENGARIRNFTYLGYCMEDGTIERIYGDPVTCSDVEDMKNFLKTDGNVIAQGLTEDKEKVLLLGKQAAYPVGGGKTSVALVAGVPMEYLNEALFLYDEDGLLYSHIIDRNGDFVIRNADAFRENYFERIREKFETFDGKDSQEYIREVREAMDTGRAYSAQISVDGQQRQIYCSPLSRHATWYLISVMPSGAIREAIVKLDSVRIFIMVGSGAVIILTMSVIFYLYYRLSRRQMLELSKAREEAVSANRAKSEFLSSMSHDIRTPMNAIIGMTEIARKNILDPARAEECLRKVQLSSKHLLGLINDVLDMSKIESGKMSLNIAPASLRDTMDDIVNIIRPQVKDRKQYFDIFIQKIQAEQVCCDSIRLNQVLLNLLSNAVKFTPEGGRIDVYVYQEPSPRGKDFVRTHFKVVDTGIGMSPQFQEKVFHTFAREESEAVRHITGTGLGMSITKSIVDMMKGSIEFSSEQGKGTSFHVILDFERASVDESRMKLPPWNVLVVDDNEQLCLSAVSSLEELGVHGEWSRDGMEAVEMISRRHERKEDYHFVLMDWKMPNMDGIETIRQIRERVGIEIPVFLISAYDWNDVESETDKNLIEGFISKPLFKSTLYEKLHQYEGLHQTEKEEKENRVEMLVGKRVLLAEDMDINWEVGNEILSAFGLILERAVNGMDCLEKFENSAIGYYDAVLMDIRMPVMDGYDATMAIRALDRPDRDLPIIAMTADAFSDDAKHCLECGMNAHIPKPLDVKECMRVLEAYLA